MFNKIMNKTKKQAEPTATQTPPASAGNTDAPNPKPESQAQPAKEQAATSSSSLEKANAFIAQIKSRRTIYALGKDKILSDKEVTE
jgi:hypothetical protein